ncbi:hypothetical protein AUK22_03360 [bacterium CG2_30_54_10]|nr:MAG: hypothetical protein AUK22_03360 [bacterium CG2_30_54_10]
MLLAIVAPLIVGWWAVTRPMLDRREALSRANVVLNNQQRQLSGLLSRAREFLARGKPGDFKTSPAILADLEALLKTIPEARSRPTIHRQSLVFQGGQYPAAEIRFQNMSLPETWKVFEILAGSPIAVAHWELSRSRENSGLDGSLLLWEPPHP